MSVYITNSQPHFDYSEAMRFGELVEVSTRLYSFHPGRKETNDALIAEMAKTLDNYDPERDYILTSGSAISNGICFAALALRGIRKVQVLSYVANDRTYVPNIVDFGAIDE